MEGEERAGERRDRAVDRLLGHEPFDAGENEAGDLDLERRRGRERAALEGDLAVAPGEEVEEFARQALLQEPMQLRGVHPPLAHEDLAEQHSTRHRSGKDGVGLGRGQPAARGEEAGEGLVREIGATVDRHAVIENDALLDRTAAGRQEAGRFRGLVGDEEEREGRVGELDRRQRGELAQVGRQREHDGRIVRRSVRR